MGTNEENGGEKRTRPTRARSNATKLQLWNYNCKEKDKNRTPVLDIVISDAFSSKNLSEQITARSFVIPPLDVAAHLNKSNLGNPFTRDTL